MSHYALTREAPDGENSVAFQAIQSEKKNVLKPCCRKTGERI
uniref:Putative ParB-like nuclease n=1 Tax=Klebsiella pneumoniae TaxID=573 RepID=A0A8B0STV2_KLEPN|nr:putative ParB-like nuclease [Klebsiella pneumoniae]